jgi:hypothetical protein
MPPGSHTSIRLSAEDHQRVTRLAADVQMLTGRRQTLGSLVGMAMRYVESDLDAWHAWLEGQGGA